MRFLNQHFPQKCHDVISAQSARPLGFFFMIILLQYTLTDIRKFANAQSLLIFPKWPLPNPYKEFVRGSGQVVPKNDTGLTSYLGRTCITENYVCKINKGVKVPKNIRLGEYSFHNKVNHYYSDGGILAKYEFLFETKLEESLSYAAFKKILTTLLEVRINMRNNTFGHSEYRFKNAVKGLRELQITTTTLKKYLGDNEQEKYILPCMPQIFVSLNRNEHITPKAGSKLAISLKDGAQSALSGWWENFGVHPYKIWLLKNNGRTDNPLIQSIRNGILRIHSEKECINNVIQSVILGFLDVQPHTTGSETLQTFLNNKIRDVDTNFRKLQGMDDTEKLEAFIKQAYDQFNPGELTLLHERIKRLDFRPQLEKKFVNHIIKYAPYIEKLIVMDNSQHVNIGDGNTIGNIKQTMTVNTISEEQYRKYYEQLDTLLSKLKEEPGTYDQKVAVNNLEKAQQAAIEKDESSFLGYLKKAGSWAADFASKIGVNFITELIKNQVE